MMRKGSDLERKSLSAVGGRGGREGGRRGGGGRGEKMKGREED